jgi:predicted amidohydrolase
VKTRSLKIALMHLVPELGALDENRALIESATRVAAELGADWTLSGELVVSGYCFVARIGTGWIHDQPDSWLHRLARLSAELGVASFVSHPERDAGSGKLYNSLFVLGRDGRLLGRHRKLHPTPGSEAWASAGALCEPVIVDGIPVGLLICADAYPPQAALRLRDAGAQLVISAAAWWPGDWGPNGEWEARTVDSGLPLVVCNRSGRGDESHISEAESVIIDRGVKLLSLRSSESTVFVVDCLIRDGRIASCELVASERVQAEAAVPPRDGNSRR